jgi:hypothetical protein
MSIYLEFINLIIPIRTIEEKYDGGWKQCLEDHKNLIGKKVWYDEHLFKDGAMSPQDMGDIVKEWKGRGFMSTVEIEGQKHWVDMCVVEGMVGGATLPCDWLEYDEDSGGVFLKGHKPGKIISRCDFG